MYSSNVILCNIAGACTGNAGNIFPAINFNRKPLVRDHGVHHGTCVTHVPWCIQWSLTHCGGENVPGIPGACATHNFTYLIRGPYVTYSVKQENHAVQYHNASGCSTLELYFCKSAGIIGPQSIIDHIATRLRENWRCIRNGIWKAVGIFLHSVWHELLLLSDVY